MIWRVDSADAREWLPSLVGQVDPARTVVVTDPPWPGVGVSEEAGWNPAETWRAVAPWFPKVARRVVVQVGCLADPRGLLDAVPGELPFRITCWLPFNVHRAHGCLMRSGDVAYVFGSTDCPPGKHMMPGQGPIPQPSKWGRRRRHPCQRNLEHLAWVMRWFTSPGDLVIDPFTGSGTTGMAAVQFGRDFLGCDNGRQDDGEPYAEEARRNIAATAARGVQGDFMEAL